MQPCGSLRCVLVVSTSKFEFEVLQFPSLKLFYVAFEDLIAHCDQATGVLTIAGTESYLDPNSINHNIALQLARQMMNMGHKWVQLFQAEMRET
jgi:hypothetical protein